MQTAVVRFHYQTSVIEEPWRLGFLWLWHTDPDPERVLFSEAWIARNSPAIVLDLKERTWLQFIVWRWSAKILSALTVSWKPNNPIFGEKISPDLRCGLTNPTAVFPVKIVRNAPCFSSLYRDKQKPPKTKVWPLLRPRQWNVATDASPDCLVLLTGKDTSYDTQCLFALTCHIARSRANPPQHPKNKSWPFLLRCSFLWQSSSHDPQAAKSYSVSYR